MILGICPLENGKRRSVKQCGQLGGQGFDWQGSNFLLRHRHLQPDTQRIPGRFAIDLIQFGPTQHRRSDNHPNAGGVLGRSGTPIASWFMTLADTIIVLGASFSNHTGISPKRNMIQVDYDRMQLGKFGKVKVPVWGEIGAFCKAAAPQFEPHAEADDQISELADRWAMWRDEKTRRLAEDLGRGIHSYAIFDALGRLAPEDAIFAVDVGNNTYSFGRYLETKGTQRVLMSGYLGSIGFGFPAGMGAWAAT